MPAERGFRFSVGPRFASALAWRERLQVGGRSSWHAASETECAELVANETTDDAWQRDICLFSIPEHLRSKWWDLAAQQIEKLPERLDGIEPFARAVAEFAQFKRIPLPRQCAFDIALTPPQDGQNSAMTGEDLPKMSPTNAVVVARINLGDERTALIFGNVGRIPDKDGGVRETGSADGPLIRLALDPGEGVWLPGREVICSVDRTGKTDLDVWLILKDQG